MSFPAVGIEIGDTGIWSSVEWHSRGPTSARETQPLVRGKVAGSTAQAKVIRKAARVRSSDLLPVRLGVALSEHGRMLLWEECLARSGDPSVVINSRLGLAFALCRIE